MKQLEDAFKALEIEYDEEKINKYEQYMQGVLKWNKVLNLRITELCEVYEYGGMYVVPTFGDALPTTINWDN